MELPAKTEVQENAYQTWLKGRVSRCTKLMRRYTAIDGGGTEPALHDQKFIQAAHDLREKTTSEIILKVHQFEGLSSRDKEKCVKLVQDVPILPGLFAYTYIHLICCRKRSRLFLDWSRVSSLEKEVERWKKNEEAWWILSYKHVRATLLDILHDTRVEDGKHKCNMTLLSGPTIPKQDVLNLAAYIALCIAGPRKAMVLSPRESEVDDLVDLCNDLLVGDVNLEEWYRRCILNLVIVLSKKAKYPKSLYLADSAIKELIEEIEGPSSVIYSGLLGSRVVALKELKQPETQTSRGFYKNVYYEATIWKHLRHPNCLPFHGLYRMPGEGSYIALVSPWMQYGNLREYLEQNPGANRESLIFDVVNGLHYLHSMRPHIAHRDVKPENVFITDTGHACLADFGFALAFDMCVEFHTPLRELNIVGTPRYEAPEILRGLIRLNKRACDMYALGCTIYTTYMGKPPFHDISEEEVVRKVLKGERPEFPEGKIPPDMWDFVRDLWRQGPSDRPTAEKALSWMKYKLGLTSQDDSDADKVELVAAVEEDWVCQRNGLLSLDSP